MIKILNKFIPLKGFSAMTVYPFVFIRKGEKFTNVTERHEMIHAEQQKEMLLVFFYLWYLFEFVVRLIQYRNRNVAYKNISFEREAYDNERNTAYLKNRKRYSFISYL